MVKVLVVEDEASIREMIAFNLRRAGMEVLEADSAEAALPLLEEKAKSTLTPVVISNMDEIKELIKLSGSVTVGETPVIRIKK